MIKVLFVIGPTASGKTDVSIKLAQEFNGEIVSADSMQIYKGIHIASAAPDREEMCGIPHHMIEFLDIASEFSVADYVKTVRPIIKDIHNRGKLPIIAGGTGLYISSLLENIEYSEQCSDIALRNELEEKFDRIGGEEMLKELSKFDMPSALRLHPNNRRRIIRAFEVYIKSGQTVTRQNALSKQNKGEFLPLVIGLNYKDRQALYDRINLRVDKMLENGLIDEAKKFYRGNSKTGAFQAIGHKEFYPFFEGKCTKEEAIEKLKMQTRRYAKRQLTWFRRIEDVNWFFRDYDNCLEDIKKLVKEFLKEE